MRAGRAFGGALRVSIPIDVRPTIIKMAPVVKELERRGIGYDIVHTGQHYSKSMSEDLFEELGIPKPDFNMGIGSCSHAEQTARALIGFERYFLRRKPDMVLVHGDANMVPSACLAAAKIGVTTMHNEAGLRCFCRRKPEEINRVVGDHLSDYLCAPTRTSKGNLLREGVERGRVVVTGNTAVDAVKMMMPRMRDVESPVHGEYIVMTVHRCEHVDDNAVLQRILRGAVMLQDHFDVPVVWPMHPRTEKMLRRFGLQRLAGKLTVLRPLGYLEFLKTLSGAKAAITDSGGVQEEACTLGVPCVTIGDATERVETLDAGSNRLAGLTPAGLLKATKAMAGARGWRNPYGNGHAARKIVDFMESKAA